MTLPNANNVHAHLIGAQYKMPLNGIIVTATEQDCVSKPFTYDIALLLVIPLALIALVFVCLRFREKKNYFL